MFVAENSAIFGYFFKLLLPGGGERSPRQT